MKRESTRGSIVGTGEIPIVATNTEKPKPKAYQDPSLDPQTKVILEFIETEEDYVNDLQTIMDVRFSGFLFYGNAG